MQVPKTSNQEPYQTIGRKTATAINPVIVLVFIFSPHNPPKRRFRFWYVAIAFSKEDTLKSGQNSFVKYSSL